MDLNHQLTVIQASQLEPLLHRFITAEKWRVLMLRVLAKLKKKQMYDCNLIDDMTIVIDRIPEEALIQTIMHIRPFRPNFTRNSRRLSRDKSELTEDSKETLRQTAAGLRRLEMSSIFKFKRDIHNKVRDSIFEVQEENMKNPLLQQTLAMITEQSTLSKQFQKEYHPFRILIDHFLFLLQHKYKNYIGSQQQVQVEAVQEMLLYDLNLLQEFVIKASVPYLKIFTCGSKEETVEFQVQLVAFIKKYIEKHGRINQLIKKIIKYTIRKVQRMVKLEQNIPNFAQINTFKVEKKFQIDGQYFYSIQSLIDLSQSTSPATSLRLLQQLRKNMLRDIDEFYKRTREPLQQKQAHSSAEEESGGGELKMSVETQLQVLKFLLTKAKIFVIEILGELKYLETVLGQDDLSYKYDDSSFMYAQLTLAIEILSLEYS